MNFIDGFYIVWLSKILIRGSWYFNSPKPEQIESSKTWFSKTDLFKTMFLLFLQKMYFENSRLNLMVSLTTSR